MVLTHLSLLTVFPTFRFYDKIISEFIAAVSFENLGQALVIVKMVGSKCERCAWVLQSEQSGQAPIFGVFFLFLSGLIWGCPSPPVSSRNKWNRDFEQR